MKQQENLNRNTLAEDVPAHKAASIGELRIVPTDRLGTRAMLYLDGHRLQHVSAWSINAHAGETQKITITFNAAPEITEPSPYIPIEDDTQHTEATRTLAEDA